MATNGRTAVITGATSGLGEAAALALARQGWRVLLVGRDAARGAHVVAAAKAAGGDAAFYAADLFSLADVARLGAVLAAAAPRLDLLVNNAGGSFQKTERTKDGLERTFALNVAAPWVLTRALVEPLAAAKGRVLNVVTGVSSGTKAEVADFDGPRAAAGTGSYVRAKLALLGVTRAMQDELGARGITFVALHPGVIPGTRFGSEMPAFLRERFFPAIARLFRLDTPIDEAAARYVRLATEPVEPAGFYYEGVLRPLPTLAGDAAFRTALTRELARVSGSIAS
jgi:NAD(P)-dependent dehydrogenase (short-subunit alcohol dehydrogenase family)